MVITLWGVFSCIQPAVCFLSKNATRSSGEVLLTTRERNLTVEDTPIPGLCELQPGLSQRRPDAVRSYLVERVTRAT